MLRCAVLCCIVLCTLELEAPRFFLGGAEGDSLIFPFKNFSRSFNGKPSELAGGRVPLSASGDAAPFLALKTLEDLGGVVLRLWSFDVFCFCLIFPIKRQLNREVILVGG